MKRSATTSRSRILLIGALIAVAAVAVVAAVQPQVSTGKNAAAAVAGMRAYIDPETGQLGTSSALPPLPVDEKARLEPVQAPRQVVLPDGSVMLELNGTGQEFTVMHIDAAGNRSIQCVQDPQRAIASPVPAAKPEGR